MRLIYVLCLLILSAPWAKARDSTVLELTSPNSRLNLFFCLKNGVANYSLKYRNQDLVQWSRLGLEFSDAEKLQENLVLIQVQTNSVQNTWEQPWGEEHFIENSFNEIQIELRESSGLQREMTLVFRAFNDGLGFRYEIGQQKNITLARISQELTEFRLNENSSAWWIPAYANEAYELLYSKSRISQMPPYTHTPLTIKDNAVYLSIHEAALLNYSSMQLKNLGAGVLVADLAPNANGAAVEIATPFTTPWRTIQVAENPGDLITSYLILNLNEPNRLGDTSFLRPMKFMGIWWAMHLGQLTWGSGPNHGATTARAKEYIDAAASLGIPGLLIEGWNLGWDSWKSKFDFTTQHPNIDLQEVVQYAHDRGIEIIGHHETGGDVTNYELQLEAAMSYYAQLGIRTVKTGYVARKIEGEFHYGQRMIQHYQHVTERAANYGISLNVHEPVKDTGLRRTYPNLMTSEGVRGNEYEAWGGPEGNPPSHTTILPFTRGLAGPMDYTPGIFAILDGARPGIDRVHTTLSKQLALFVVLYSPMQMVADLPKNYIGEAAFEFIRRVPVDWHTTKVLNGEIGEYITTVRRDRDSDSWFLGSITNESQRNFSISLSFLEPFQDYCITRYKDSTFSHWENNPLAYEIHSARVQSTDFLSLQLASGGGEAIIFDKCGSPLPNKL